MGENFDIRRQGGGRATRTVTAPSDRRLTDDEICGANTNNGTPCRAARGRGTDHEGYGNCTRHGGTTEAGVKSAAREMGRDLITQHKATDPQRYRFGGDRRDASLINLSPEQALVEEVRRSAAMVRFLEERIALWGLDVHDATIADFMKSSKGRPNRDNVNKEIVDEFLRNVDPTRPDSAAYLPALVDINKNSGLSAFTNAREWLYLYREERSHLARVSKMALDAGVAQRLVNLAEDQGRILASALRVVLQALNLTPEQQALVPVIVPAVLRAVANDQPVPDISSLISTPQQVALS